MFRALLLTSLLALPAAAECVTVDDLVKGIGFTRQDGHKGRFQTQGGTLLVDYVIDRDRWTDARVTRLGIYEQHFAPWLSDLIVVGSAPPEYDWRFAARPPLPKPGKGCSGIVHQTETNLSHGTEMMCLVSRNREVIAVQFTYLDEGQGKLSGCTYRTLPVEATFTGRDGAFTRRWIYFLDLGFGLETRRDGVSNGLIALTAE